MKEKVLAILSKSHPEFDFTEVLTSLSKACLIHLIL